jgi:hypothetical protein
MGLEGIIGYWIFSDKFGSPTIFIRILIEDTGVGLFGV